MNIGEKLYKLRRDKNLSQEELADKLNVTRQTISKWETNQSMPDFDKIDPICKLYGITPNDLLSNNNEIKNNQEGLVQEDKEKRNKKALGISIGIVIYFLSIIWIMVSIPVMRINPIVSSAIFLLLCGIATGIIVYVCITCKQPKEIRVKSYEEKLRNQITSVVSIFVTVIYFYISFRTMAWHITWLIWVIFGLFDEVLKLIFMLKGDNNEK